ncbi:MAG: transporter [Haloplasmataceae bacterium]|jgi:DHA1 family multidrug resistance protein-like MFS transporter|nr:transporter [Haloplasmataceae bacterium]
MKKQLYVLIAVITITTIINNMAHPVTPELVISLGYSSFLFGVLFATMSLANFLMSPFWGILSDKYGRKPFMIISPIGYGLAQIGFGYSTNPIIIVLFRLLAGSFSCAIFVCGMATLIDLTDLKNRSKMMSIYTATTGFGANIGYLLGGFIGNNDYHYAFITQSTLSIFSAIAIFLFIKETKKRKAVIMKSNIKIDLLKYKSTILPFMLIITILTSLISIGFNNGFNFFMKDHMDFSPYMIGIVMSITGIIGLMTNIVLYPIFKRIFNDFNLLVLSILMIGLTLALVTYINNANMRILFLVPFFAFLALYKPLLQSIISRLGNNNGEIMGLNNASNAFGNVIGSFYVGWAYSININITFYSLSIVSFFVLILLLSQRNKFKNMY